MVAGKRGSFLTGLLHAFAALPGVEDVSAFDAVEGELRCELPADYKGFLMRTNGGETLPPLPRFRFYPVEELLPRRADGEPTNTLEFGTDDGDGFAFDLERGRVTSDYPIVRYPLGETTREELDPVADTFEAFVEWLSTARVW